MAQIVLESVQCKRFTDYFTLRLLPSRPASHFKLQRCKLIYPSGLHHVASATSRKVCRDSKKSAHKASTRMTPVIYSLDWTAHKSSLDIHQLFTMNNYSFARSLARSLVQLSEMKVINKRFTLHEPNSSLFIRHVLQTADSKRAFCSRATCVCVRVFTFYAPIVGVIPFIQPTLAHVTSQQFICNRESFAHTWCSQALVNAIRVLF